MNPGDKVELVNEVKGEKIGTRATIREIGETEALLDMGVNDVVMVVALSDIKKV